MAETVNQFKTNLRTFVLADTAVTALIGQRFFGAALATLFHFDDSQFPLATFVIGPGAETHQGIVHTFDLDLAAHSKDSHDEAQDVYDVLRTRLLNVIISPRITISFSGSPQDLYDETGRIYSAFGRARVTRIP